MKSARIGGKVDTKQEGTMKNNVIHNIQYALSHLQPGIRKVGKSEARRDSLTT
jgi:hypothetical protein